MKKHILIIILFSQFVLLHQIGFGQWSNANNLLINQIKANPSLAGGALAPRVSSSYLSKWPKLPVVYSQYQIANDVFLEPYRVGFGVQMESNLESTGQLQKKTSIGLVYSYTLPFEDFNIRFGNSIELESFRLNANELLFPDQISNGTIGVTAEQLNRNTQLKLNSSIGFSFITQKSTLGFSVLNLNRKPIYFFKSSEVKNQNYFFGFQSAFKVWEKKSEYYQKYNYSNFISIINNLSIQGSNIQLKTGLLSSYSNFKIGLLYEGIPFLRKPSGVIDNESLQIIIGYQDKNLLLNYQISYGFNSFENAGFSQGIIISYQFGAIDFSKKKYNDTFIPSFSW